MKFLKLSVIVFSIFLFNQATAQSQLSPQKTKLKPAKLEKPAKLQKLAKPTTKRMFCECSCEDFSASAQRFGKSISNCINSENPEGSFADVTGMLDPTDRNNTWKIDNRKGRDY